MNLDDGEIKLTRYAVSYLAYLMWLYFGSDYMNRKLIIEPLVSL